MSKALRFSEKWFQRALWLVAIVFAFFLMAIGSQDIESITHTQELDELKKQERIYQTQIEQNVKPQIENC
jgi:hypothetical protein